MLDHHKEIENSYIQMRAQFARQLMAIPVNHPEFPTLGRQMMAASQGIRRAVDNQMKLHENFKDVAHMPPAVSRGPAGWVDVDKRSGDTTLYLNAMHMYELLRGAGDRHPRTTLGLSMSSRPEHVQGMLRYVKESGIDKQTAEELEHLFNHAAANAGDKGIIIVRTGDKIRTMLETIYEERTHGFQRALGILAGSTSLRETGDHLDPIHFSALYSFMPTNMRKYLDDVYMNPTVETAVIEATAKLIYDDPTHYGVSEDEALDYLSNYFDLLIQKHGPDALDSLTTARTAVEDIRRNLIESLKPGEYGREGSSVRPTSRVNYPEERVLPK
jgi:hypothetical protein